MKLSKVKVGSWYETKSGVGQCVQRQGWHPPAAKFHIVAPFPRGTTFVAPRDIIRELRPEELPPAYRTSPTSGRAHTLTLVVACAAALALFVLVVFAMSFALLCVTKGGLP